MNDNFLKPAIILVILSSILIMQFCTKKNDEPQTPKGNKPSAAFVSNTTDLIEGESVQFTDQSTNSPTNWLWTFGDGGTSTEQNPTHIYASKGTYTVALSVSNEFGSGQTTKEDYIKVIKQEEVGISEAFVNLEESNGTIESYNVDAGTAIIKFISTVPQVVTGSVLTIDMDTMGYLRKVVSSQVNGNTLTLETEQAFLTDIFVDKDFNLNTEMIEPNQTLKSTSSNLEISRALTDQKGFIHPVEIIYKNQDGKTIIKSVLNNKPESSESSYKIIDFTKNLSNTNLYGKDGDDVHFYIKTGEASLISNAVFEFDFDYKGELTQNTRVKKGDLNSFKFYLQSEAGFLAKLALEMKKEFTKEDQKKLMDVARATVKFIVGTVPVWISFDVDIYGKYSLTATTKLSAEMGFRSKHTLSVGGTYDKNSDSFTPIKEYVPENTIYPLSLSGEVNLAARLELFPRVEVLFYSFFGPFAEIVPYLEANYKSGFQSQLTSSGTKTFIAWNSSLDLGLDFRIGSKLTFLWGLQNKEFGPSKYPLFKTQLWKAPNKISLLTELPAEADAKSKFSLKYKVTDMLDNGVPQCPVYIDGDGTISENMVTTNANGEAFVDWTLKSEAEENNIAAIVYDATKTIVDQKSTKVTGLVADSLPTVSTADISNITENSATSGGNVTNQGKSDVTARGICWNTFGSPTTDSNKSNNGAGLGSFTTNMNGLDPGTSYHVRAYATNAQGTTYGEEKVFTTYAEQGASTNLIDSRNGRTYKTVVIGSQTWMAENLDYLPGGYMTSSLTPEKWDTSLYYKGSYTFGALYNWYAAMGGQVNGSSDQGRVQGVCPSGWHLPSDEEWKILEIFAGMSQSEVDKLGYARYSDVGKKLKSTNGCFDGYMGRPGIYPPGCWRLYPWYYTLGTDDYGFTAEPGGWARYMSDYNGGYKVYIDGGGSLAAFWTSSKTDGGTPIYRRIDTDYDRIERDSEYPKMAVSIRCVKD